jgi:hypothetical protein
MKNYNQEKCNCCGGQIPQRSKFVVGIPKGSHWFRVQNEYLQNIGDYNRLLEKYKLETRPQDDDFVLIYGDKEKSVEFLKELGELTKEALEKGVPV